MKEPRDSSLAAIQTRARAIATTIVARDRDGVTDPAPLRELAALGLLAAPAPGEAAALCEAMIELGAGSGDAGLALAWAAHTLGCALPIARLADPRLRARLLPRLEAGALVGAWAHRDAVGSVTRARRGVGGYVLEGRKAWVVNGPIADVLLVTAITDDDRDELSAFVVERGAPGLCCGPRLAVAGARTCGIAELRLEGVHASEDSMIGAPGDGRALVLPLVHRWQRGCQLAPWLGLLQAAVADVTRRARAPGERARPRAASQSTPARVADMRLQLALCERMLARGAWQLDHHEADAERDLVAARLFVGDAIEALAREAQRLCAPGSCAPGDPLERLARDAPFADLLGHDRDTLRSILAGALLGLG
ncbi:MAG: acyl-CoA dehydrogenase [Nannocystaceae bacterium]